MLLRATKSSVGPCSRSLSVLSVQAAQGRGGEGSGEKGREAERRGGEGRHHIRTYIANKSFCTHVHSVYRHALSNPQITALLCT